MKNVAKILNIISMIFGFWMILPLVFGIIVNKKISNGEPLTTGDKICTLLFVNIISGILLLCDKDA